MLRSLATLALAAVAASQGPPANGPAPADLRFDALVHATVVVKPGQRIERATLVLQNGRVVYVAEDAPAPAGARVTDCTGLVIYPGFVESYLPVDAPAPDADAADAHWHPSVLAQRSALDGDGATKDDRETLRSLGFCAAAIAPIGGNFRGTGAVVLLDEPKPGVRAEVLGDPVYHVASLAMRWGGHPSSEMGAISLVRQVLADAQWRERTAAALANDPALRTPTNAANAALATLTQFADRPIAFDCDDELQILRVAKIAGEFQRPAFVIGSGMEFRRAQAIAATKLPIVLPLAFPEAPDVSTLSKQERVSLRQLQTWEHAPSNLARLRKLGVDVALTTARLQDKKDFHKNLAEAMAWGVTADDALAMITTIPARLLQRERDLGTLEAGRVANLVVVDGDLFDKKSRIRAVWVAGVRHEIEQKQPQGLDGDWTLRVQQEPVAEFSVHVEKGEVTAKSGDRKAKVGGVASHEDRIEFWITDESLGKGAAWIRLRRSGDTLTGTAQTEAADVGATASRAEPKKDEPKADAGTADAQKGDAKQPDAAKGDVAKTDATKDEQKKDDEPKTLNDLPTPLGGYGALARPAQQNVVFVGATLWTNGGAGIVENGALWIDRGAIRYAGPREGLPADAKGAQQIDSTGKHITPGLIDCHSHTGISRGVNEGGEAITAEARVQDVVDPDDMNWYRQLAGGVTAVSQLHGSANAIGGQSSTVKIRWGSLHPDEMAFAGAASGIKFALGENPRGANGGGEDARYPGTRMGVEALLRDRFLAAQDYARRMTAYEQLAPRDRANALPPRRDLELEAVAEILAGKRRVHCHSYRQDEIFMFCRMAKEFGFRIGTFQHVLEGYKVAEAIRDSAIGASAFSDWWGYKFEVFDAVPDNGAILREVGVCVSFNSDSDEHARRLNTEAGKAVKYGGVPPQEALKFVTLNPAIQLGIETQTGSLEAGKHADFAVWNVDPLSYDAVCERTWVDGAERFSIERDRELRTAVRTDRSRLLRKALAAAGAKGRVAKDDERDAYWRAEDTTEAYCCRDCEGANR